MKKNNFKDRGQMRRRMTAVAFAITAVISLLIIRLSYIMIIKAPDYAGRAEEQWTSEVRIDAIRGKILDRNGKELAVSANVYRVDFDLNSIRTYLKTKLSDLSDEQIAQRKSAGIPLPTDDEGITTNDIAPLIANALGLETSKVQDKLETRLPSGAAAGSATLIRRIGKAGVKITELEKNKRDLPYTISEFTSPENGKDVTLTIDENIQAFAEKTAL